METRTHTYAGTDVTVTWSKTRCIHFAACVRGLPDVFDPDARPWIQPEEAPADAVAEVVARCPTGALHARLADGTDPEPEPTEAVVTVDANGPLFLRGSVTVQDAEGEVLLRDTRVALCRCGLSQHKPLCDNSHVDAFTDDGTLPADDAPTIEAAEGAELVVTCRPNGSILVVGPFTMTGADGQTVAKGKAGLCRCGHSGRKPYCDGSHRDAGFVAP